MERPTVADAPLFIGVVGLLIIVVLLFSDSIDRTWGVTLGLFCAILMLSSLFSMSPQIPDHVKNKKRGKL